MDTREILVLEGEQGGASAGNGTCCEIPARMFQKNASCAQTIQNALDTHAHVKVPFLPYPVMLDRPLCLGSGNRLTVDGRTVMRMMPGCGGCMVRNAHPADGRTAPFDSTHPDTDMLVEGGIWEDAESGVSPNDENAVMQAFGSSKAVLIDGQGRETSVIGTQGGHGALLGVFFFNNAERFTVRNVTVRRCAFYAVLVSGGSHFVIEDMTFDHNKTDGVHVNGPSSYGAIRRMHGKCGDDFVALNAWDWELSAVSFGAVHHMLIEDIDCAGDELRLLPGRKTFVSGEKTECPVYGCVYRNIRNAYCVKMYQQPNCSNDLTGRNDRSEIAGEIKNVLFSGMELNALTDVGFGEVKVGALFEICADCTDITFENIRVGVSREAFTAAGMRLAEVGPKSSTWKRGHTDPRMWAELFDTGLIVKADGLTFRNVSFAGEACTDRDILAGCHRLKPNPDYPNTTPKGGTGYGILGTVTVE